MTSFCHHSLTPIDDEVVKIQSTESHITRIGIPRIAVPSFLPSCQESGQYHAFLPFAASLALLYTPPHTELRALLSCAGPILSPCLSVSYAVCRASPLPIFVSKLPPLTGTWTQ